MRIRQTILLALCAFVTAYVLDRSLLTGQDVCFVNAPITIINSLLRMVSGG
jgi:hypothetical protein